MKNTKTTQTEVTGEEGLWNVLYSGSTVPDSSWRAAGSVGQPYRKSECTISKITGEVRIEQISRYPIVKPSF